jgi:ATP adenylyltransferase
MTFDDLIDFLENRMSMSHIYQPLLIRALVDSDGTSTLRQLAQSFLLQDESQLLFYEKCIRQMPLKILKKHGVVDHQRDLVSLTTGKLDMQQRAAIKMLCETRLQEFVKKRGFSIWDYRLLELDPVPDDLRYRALKESGGRCALCGATSKDTPLDVDHIIPRSRGGKNVPENLQVLCAKCNRTKGNKDETDFRGEPTPEKDKSCLFCSVDVSKRIIAENGTVFAIEDQYPVTPNHSLVIPLRHTPDYFSMTSTERQDAENLLRMLRNRIGQSAASVQGFNVGINCGDVAGQTVPHAHIHLILRRRGDVENPRGGVRGVIPERMSY